ncbi:TonB-dependent receptor plug domain-containing protein [Sphingomonas profundi]|uniref:TonB-dependent receptor plug domain-containing protein n=1 Tax=Alterirhizorhabdus profundi TaxID=2681549 RepID=UPI0012E8C4D0|nr:TonB-dependent receptor [Sphingomonas profundi]
MRYLLSAVSLLALATPAIAQDRTAPSTDGRGGDADTSFGLGQIIVTAPRPQGIAIGGETLGQEAIYTFNRNSLDEAASIIPGVTASNTGGSRNERLIFVRGFDRFQVPLSIDGIRVYLPADNRLDYGRFLTPDIAEIQVAKGYASVLDGPGALGGAINLVTRKPTKALETEARGTLNLDRDVDYGGYNVFGLLGTKQDKFYVQGSYTRNVQDHWDLAGGFTPTVNQSAGARDLSATRDWRVNAKAGFTPNATDEYAISYTRQEGRKNAPLNVTDDLRTTPLPAGSAPIVPGSPTPRFWSWPYWNIESLYCLSTTALGDQATLKTRAYRNEFNNLLRSFNDRTQTTQTLGRAFNSYYADRAYGGSAQLDVQLLPEDRFSLAAYYRRDKHVEYQQGFPSGFTEPPQENLEDTYSIAAENLLAITPALSLTLGTSYDWRDLKKAQEYGTPRGGGAARLFSYPLANSSAFNWQGRLEWRPEEGTTLHASISRRSRFPTIFERFSTQFGTAASNPGLDPERATNYEIGGTRAFGPIAVEAAAFYSDISKAIVSIRPAGAPAGVSQRQNLGDARYYGAELSVTARLGATLLLGANYSYIHRDFDIRQRPGVILPLAFQLTDVPGQKGFAYADWSPTPRLHVVPSIEAASNRTTLASTTPTPPGVPLYYRTGSYVQGNFRIDYEIVDGMQIGIGGRNLFDDNYQLVDGFPEPGRSFFASVRARY